MTYRNVITGPWKPRRRRRLRSRAYAVLAFVLGSLAGIGFVVWLMVIA